uniref:Uncharacterized protein n=1 Tax=Lactuca sativa TaxID=4236 RepID=A0A9R1WY84_LACSA|nr:hypothetical protein LSAT_V11C800434760 [Lactuca sativa]
MYPFIFNRSLDRAKGSVDQWGQSTGSSSTNKQKQLTRNYDEKSTACFIYLTYMHNADASNYSIYVHSEPSFIFDETTTRSSFFYNRQLSNNIKVDWGESTMIEAERLLLQAALENPAN